MVHGALKYADWNGYYPSNTASIYLYLYALSVGDRHILPANSYERYLGFTDRKADPATSVS